MKNFHGIQSAYARLAGRSRVWLQTLSLIAVFVCGGISGAFLAAHKARLHIRSMLLHPEKAADQIVQELISELSLDESQAAKIEEIVKRRHAAIIGIRRDSAPLYLKEFDELERESLEILDPEQQEVFRKIASFARDFFLLPEAYSEAQDGANSLQ